MAQGGCLPPSALRAFTPRGYLDKCEWGVGRAIDPCGTTGFAASQGA